MFNAVKTIALIMALAAGSVGAFPAAAQSDMKRNKEMWDKVQDETVSAQRMMSGDVTNGLSMVGDVDNLILDPMGKRVEYILYDVPYTYSLIGDDDGFVRWDNIEVERGFGSTVDLRIESDNSAQGKEELRLTRSQAKGRLVDEIIAGDVRFSDGTTRGIDDILFDPDTGYITHFVVEMDDEDLFGNDNRLIPSSMVTMDRNSGYWTVSQPMTYNYQVWIY